MTVELIFDNALVVLPDRLLRGHVVCRDGDIAEIGEGRTQVPGAAAGRTRVALSRDTRETCGTALTRDGRPWPNTPTAMLESSPPPRRRAST